MFTITKESLELTQNISKEINDQTFHHHYHILYDIAQSYPENYVVNYLEIGCFAGGSACLMMNRPLTNVFSIDLGYPISPSVVYENINKFNKYSNKYEYIQGNSQSIETLNIIKSYNIEFDILFIDGDHSFNGVINDYNLYYQIVKQGGYIVFDDYADYRYSPEVKTAVDYIINNNNGFEVIGAFGNEFGARGECPSMNSGPYEREHNEFVIKKI